MIQNPTMSSTRSCMISLHTEFRSPEGRSSCSSARSIVSSTCSASRRDERKALHHGDCRPILLVTEQQDTLLSFFLRGRTSILPATCLPSTAFDQGISLFADHPVQHANRGPVRAIAVKTQRPRDGKPSNGRSLDTCVAADDRAGRKDGVTRTALDRLLDSRTSDRARRFSRADCFTSDLITKMFVIGALLRPNPTEHRSWAK